MHGWAALRCATRQRLADDNNDNNNGGCGGSGGGGTAIECMDFYIIWIHWHCVRGQNWFRMEWNSLDISIQSLVELSGLVQVAGMGR
jgi:hypothetical protein